MGGTPSTGQRASSIQEVLVYFDTRQGQAVPVQAVVKHVGATLSTVSSTLSRLVREEPQRWERVRRGVYRYTPEGREIPDTPPTELFLEVIARQPDGKIIARDVDTAALYVVAALSV